MSLFFPIKQTLYEFLYILGLLVYLPKGLWRRRLPHRGWAMRVGRYPAELRARLRGPDPIWIHAVSVGEVLAIRPLVRALRAAHPHIPLVLSTVTAGGFDVASQTVGHEGAAICSGPSTAVFKSATMYPVTVSRNTVTASSNPTP